MIFLLDNDMSKNDNRHEGDTNTDIAVLPIHFPTAGWGMGFVFLIALVAGVVYWWCRRRKYRAQRDYVRHYQSLQAHYRRCQCGAAASAPPTPGSFASAVLHGGKGPQGSIASVP